MQLNWKDADSSTIACHIGALYVGCVVRTVPEGWREWAWLKEPAAEEPMRTNREYAVEHYTKYEATPWRVLIMRDENGEDLGYFETVEMAKEKLATAVRKALEQSVQ